MGAVGRTVATGIVGSALLGMSLLGATSGHAAPATAPLTIWVDAAHAPVLTEMLAKGYKGTPVTIVTKELADVRAALAATPVESAPDVIWGDQQWSGELAAAGTIIPVQPDEKRADRFRTSVLDGFTFGAERFGVPVQISNVALITNAELVKKQPTTFGQLSKRALALVSKGKAKTAFAVAQGEGSDGYAMYPLFSGLGGYFFGRTPEGGLDQTNVGLASKAFLKNSDVIDQWNASGLISSALSADNARKAFVKKKAPFWIAGPDEMATLKALSFVYRITSVPPIVAGTKAAPLLRVQGFMVTSFAKKHGLKPIALKLVSTYLTAPSRQAKLAAASGLNPANTLAATKVAEPRLVAIGLAGVDGVPVPNIPQMTSVWGPYGGAWISSTAGTGATPAKDAFTAASDAVTKAIG